MSYLSVTSYYTIIYTQIVTVVAIAVKKGRDSEKRKSNIEIMANFIKLNDEIPVCVAATVDDLQIFKLQISDSMSNYLTSVVQHLKKGQ